MPSFVPKPRRKNLAEDGDSSPTEYAEQRVEYVVSDTEREVGHEAKSKIDQKIDREEMPIVSKK